MSCKSFCGGPIGFGPSFKKFCRNASVKEIYQPTSQRNRWYFLFLIVATICWKKFCDAAFIFKKCLRGINFCEHKFSGVEDYNIS